MAGKLLSTVATDAAGKRTVTQRGGSYAREQTGDAQQQRIQDLSARETASARSIPMAQGVLLRDVSIPVAFAAVGVKHGLGRKPQGWLISRQRVLGNVIEVESASIKSDAQFLQMLSDSASMLFDLWVW